MKKLAVLASVLAVLASFGVALSQRDRGAVGRRPTTVELPKDECAPQRQIVEIRTANPAADKNHHDVMRQLFIDKAKQPNTTILLGPDVVLDFKEVETFPIEIGRCVTIKSVAWFDPAPSDSAVRSDGAVITRVGPPPSRSSRAEAIVRRRADETAVGPSGPSDHCC